MGGSAVRWIPCQRKRGRWLGLKRLLWRSGSSGNASTRICHFSLHSREIGVRLELSYFSEVPWAVLDAANKASGENAWGSSRLLTELLCEDGTGVGIALSPRVAQLEETGREKGTGYFSGDLRRGYLDPG